MLLILSRVVRTVADSIKAFYDTYSPSELNKESVIWKMLKGFPNLLVRDYTGIESVVRKVLFCFLYIYKKNFLVEYRRSM